MKKIFKQIVIGLLTWQAKAVLARLKPRVVAITGSLGKTGTKDMVAAALSAKYTVRKSPKSFNSEFGVPLTVLGLPNAWNNPVKWIANILKGFYIAFFSKEYADVLVLEIGADKPGDIAQVASWLRADVVIITAVPEVPVHVEFYPTAEAVLREKKELIGALIDGGLLITGPDERVATLSSPSGRVERVECNLANVICLKGKPVGTEFKIGQRAVKMLGVLGKHQGLAVAIALGVANELDVNIEKVIKAIESNPKTSGRMRLIEGKHGSTIIDDSYNSSPTALKAALETLGELEVSGRKIAILGDMRELGENSDKEHRRAGLQVAHIVDELYTLGPAAAKLAETAIEEGLAKSSVCIYDTDKAVEVGKNLSNKIKADDIILVKSSQGKLRLEKTVKELMMHPEQAKELLVRQEPEWLKR